VQPASFGAQLGDPARQLSASSPSRPGTLISRSLTVPQPRPVVQMVHVCRAEMGCPFGDVAAGDFPTRRRLAPQPRPCAPVAPTL